MNIQNVKNFLSYFDPTTEKFGNAGARFSMDLEYSQQWETVGIVALAILVSTPFLWLGGLIPLAVFRAWTVKRYDLEVYNSDGTAKSEGVKTAEKVDRYAQRELLSMPKEDFIEQAKSIFDKGAQEEDDGLEDLLNELYKKYQNNAHHLLSELRGHSEAKTYNAGCLQLAIELHDSFHSVDAFIPLLNWAASLEEGEADSSSLVAFCEGASNVEEIRQVHQFLSEIGKEEEEDLFDAFVLIQGNFQGKLAAFQCLQVIYGQIDSGKRWEVIKNFRELILAAAKTPFELNAILTNLQTFGNEGVQQAKELAHLVAGEGNQGAYGEVLALVLGCMAGIEDKMQSPLLENISSCLEGIEEGYIRGILQILQCISIFDSNQRVGLLNTANQHINSKMHPTERRLILNAVSNAGGEGIEDELLQEMIEVKRSVFEFLRQIQGNDNRKEMMEVINKLPRRDREGFLAALVPILDQMTHASQLEGIIDGLKMIAPKHRRDVVKSFSNQWFRRIDFSWDSLVSHAFSSDEILRDSKKYLQELLEAEADEKTARAIAKRISENFGLFGIQENNISDPLNLIVICLLDIDSNLFTSVLPHQVYRRHLLMDARVETPKIKVPENEICGKRIRMNQPEFEKRVRDSQRLTFEGLATPITWWTLHQLFVDFEQRLNALSQEERKKILQIGIGNRFNLQSESPEDIYSSYYTMRSAFLESTYVKNTLHARGEDHEVVPTGYLHMYASIKYILDASDEVDPKTGLTEQEFLLINMITSIENCETGKSQGFEMFYGDLPAEARFMGKTEAMTPKEKAKAYLDSVVQSVLASFLTQPGKMAEELGGYEEDAARKDGQFVHSSNYLQNIIARRVGWQRDICYDVYIGCINPVLYNKGAMREQREGLDEGQKGQAFKKEGERILKEILPVFYKHLTPQLFLQLVYGRIIGELVPNLDKIKELDKILVLDEQLKEVQANLKASDNEKGKEKVTKAEGELQEKSAKLEQALKNAMESQGIEDVQEVEDKLDEEHKKINDELYKLWTAFFTSTPQEIKEGAKKYAFDELFEFTDSTMMGGMLSQNGLVQALIEAGYFVQV